MNRKIEIKTLKSEETDGEKMIEKKESFKGREIRE